MKSKVVHILTALVAIEGVVLAGLVLSRYRVVVRRGVSSNVPPWIANPLYGALEYESPDSKFEQFVKQYPGWVSFIPPGASNSILAMCADAKETNYVRILITNGANVQQAVKEEKAKHNEGAVQLLERIQSGGIH